MEGFAVLPYFLWWQQGICSLQTGTSFRIVSEEPNGRFCNTCPVFYWNVSFSITFTQLIFEVFIPGIIFHDGYWWEDRS